MRPTQRPLLRLAVAIFAQLTARRSTARLTELPAANWHRCEELVRQIRRTELRGWHLAGEVLRGDLHSIVRSLQVELAELAQQLAAAGAVTEITTLSDIYEDLVALQSEYAELTSDYSGRTLAVTTAPIELEGHDLGPFEIHLDWTRLAGEPDYRVIALEPRHAATRENVTHPHVMDEILCEGEGRVAIRQALAQGRLLDFFTLVAQLLRTYNRDSSFVALTDWEGETCSDCGATVDEEERYACQACDDYVCNECERTCGGCDETFCSGCIVGCAACDDGYCQNCLTRCEGCRAQVCSGCRDENQKCPKCQEELEAYEPLETTIDDSPEVPQLAIQPDRVGQTLVST